MTQTTMLGRGAFLCIRAYGDEVGVEAQGRASADRRTCLRPPWDAHVHACAGSGLGRSPVWN